MAPPDQMMLQPSVHSALRATRPRLQSALDAIGEELRNLEEQRRALLEEEEGLRTLLGLGEASPNGKILRGRVALEVVVSILQEIGAGAVHRDELWSIFRDRGYEYRSRAAFMALLRNYSKDESSPLFRRELTFGLNTEGYPAETPSEEERMMIEVGGVLGTATEDTPF